MTSHDETNGLLSTIVPVGNISETLENLRNIRDLARKNKVRLILVIDDVHEEKFKKELESLVTKDSMVTITSFQGRNPGGARNHGLKLCKSPWVHFCDSDDVPNFESIMKLLKDVLSNPNYDAIVGNYVIFDVAKKSNANVFASRSRFGLFGVAGNPGIWRWIFRREVLNTIQFPDNRLGEDQVFLCRLLQNNPMINLQLHSNIYTYIQGGSSQLIKKDDMGSLFDSLQHLQRLDLRKTKMEFKLTINYMYLRLCYTYVRLLSRARKLSAVRVGIGLILKMPSSPTNRSIKPWP